MKRLIYKYLTYFAFTLFAIIYAIEFGWTEDITSFYKDIAENKPFRIERPINTTFNLTFNFRGY
jgi:hypothetical protein